jgi:protein ImuB
MTRLPERLTQRQFVCVSLPFWQTERLERLERMARGPWRASLAAGPPDSAAPLATVAAVSGGQRLVALNPAASASGLSSGMMLAAARALVPDLAIAPDDPAGSAAQLRELARWATRWTPFAAPVAPPAPGLVPGSAALVLDVTGCAHLFGGMEALAGEVARRIRTLGFTARVAAGPTAGAAFALAACAAGDGPGLVVPPERLEAMMARLPVEALRIAAATAAGLRAVGLKSVGAVAKVAPDALARRFGAELPRQLARTLGREQEAISPVDEPVERRARVRLADPLVTLEGLEIALGRAVGEMCALLERRCEGARRLMITLWRVDGATFALEAGASRPHHDAAQWTRLLAEQLHRRGETLDLGFGVDLVEAAVPLAERLVAEPVDLDPVAAAALRSSAAVHRLADRLSARIGAGRVNRLALVDLWAPERAQLLRPALAPSPGTGRAGQAGGSGADPVAGAVAGPSAPPAVRLRPPLLMDAPEPVEALAGMPDGPPRLVRWRNLALKIARAEGPERLAGTAGGARDYYRVETDAGRRLWLFRKDPATAGADGGADSYGAAAPQWFVHGLG